MIHPYASPIYGKSLAHWGKAETVAEWGCNLIARAIPGGGTDVFGTYPIAVLKHDADVRGGLEHLAGQGHVAATLVLDDFTHPPLEYLRPHFDVLRPFKTHYIRRNALPFKYDKHHRYEVTRANRKVTARAFDLAQTLTEWMALYSTLVQRHSLAGLHDFPREHFEALGALEGVTAIGAWLDSVLVSAHIWVSDGTHVHSHLAASSEAGYKAGAAYAIYDASIRHFADAALLNFGGGAGTLNDSADGLARFKQGFSNDSAEAYIAGAILDKPRYDSLCIARAVSENSSFFPAYRTPKV